ncbi:MAG: sulfotransferase family 2 domain-containing protein [Hyphomicrobium sp.]
MRHKQRRVRNYLLGFIGVQGNMQVWWTPEIPIIYIGNPKAGCSTIQQSLKRAQAAAYSRAGRNFDQNENPHTDDDCLRRKGLSPVRCRDRHLFSCVRNPFSRTLSAYLDKVVAGDHREYVELRGMRTVSFESFLRALADSEPTHLDVHFRPQHVNLNYSNINYDAVFFLENSAAIEGYLQQVVPDFALERFSPHARRAQEKLAAHYSPTTVELVRQIYARDFQDFGYSLDLDDALSAPGVMIAENSLLHIEAAQPLPPCPSRSMRDTRTLENTLRCRWLIEKGLI